MGDMRSVPPHVAMLRESYMRQHPGQQGSLFPTALLRAGVTGDPMLDNGGLRKRGDPSVLFGNGASVGNVNVAQSFPQPSGAGGTSGGYLPYSAAEWANRAPSESGTPRQQEQQQFDPNAANAARTQGHEQGYVLHSWLMFF